MYITCINSLTDLIQSNVSKRFILFPLKFILGKKISFLFLVLFCFFLSFNSLKAAYLKNVPQTLIQPNGIIVNCFASGDEFYNWHHDAAGYTIIQNPTTGYYVYADLHHGDLIATNFLVNLVDPDTLNIQKYLKISKEKYRNRINSIQKVSPHQTNTPTTGKINNIVVFIRFNGESEFTDQYYYPYLFNSSSRIHNSMYNYFKEVSYNQLEIESSFYPRYQNRIVSYQDSNSRSYFQPYNAVTNPDGYIGDVVAREREHTLLKNAIEAAKSDIPISLDIDADNDGNVDNVCFIVSGDVDGWSDLLWPHMWTLFSKNVKINNKRVWNYNLNLKSSIFQSGNGVLCHEMFHSLGAPDLYHYENLTSEPISPVGTWDLMDSITNPPQHMSAYMKYRYGKWIPSIPEITMTGTYTINPLHVSFNNCFQIPSSTSSDECFVVEYRDRSSGMFENSLPGSGIIVYRINSDVSGQGNSAGPPDEVYVYRPNGNVISNGNLRLAHFNSHVGRTSITDFTNPSSFLSDGTPGGLIISDIGTPGNTISFHVTIPVHQLTIPSDGTMIYSNSLTSGIWYTIFVEGTFQYHYPAEPSAIADAEWAETTSLGNPGWNNPSNSNLELLINNQDIDWGGYNSSHKYAYINVGMGSPISFKINDDSYGDNQGSLTVRIETGGSRPKVFTPILNPSPGTYNHSVDVSINNTIDGAVIRYTTDATAPTETSTIYSLPIQISSTTTIKAKAFKDYWNASEIAEGLFTVVDPTDVSDEFVSRSFPLEFQLYQNIPNPFNPQTSIAFSIPKAKNIKILIYDNRGRVVNTLLDKTMAAGEHVVKWDGKNSDGNFVSSGVYFYILKAPDLVKTGRAVLIK